MLSLRQPGRSPLARTIARVLMVALLVELVPFQASTSTTSPALSFPHELPAIPQGELEGGEEVLVCVVVVILTKSAFGGLLAHSGDDPQPYAFTGEPLDPNSGWQYHRARWMDPRMGRFGSMGHSQGEAYGRTAPVLYSASDVKRCLLAVGSCRPGARSCCGCRAHSAD